MKLSVDWTPPVAVIERDATNIIATTDKFLAKALHVIRDQACKGLTVKKLLDRLRISRARLESTFRAIIVFLDHC
jgi:LacI family transcriptional regulator